MLRSQSPSSGWLVGYKVLCWALPGKLYGQMLTELIAPPRLVLLCDVENLKSWRFDATDTFILLSVSHCTMPLKREVESLSSTLTWAFELFANAKSLHALLCTASLTRSPVISSSSIVKAISRGMSVNILCRLYIASTRWLDYNNWMQLAWETHTKSKHLAHCLFNLSCARVAISCHWNMHI